MPNNLSSGALLSFYDYVSYQVLVFAARGSTYIHLKCIKLLPATQSTLLKVLELEISFCEKQHRLEMYQDVEKCTIQMVTPGVIR